MATAPDDTTKFLKVPPHSLEAEASVLGGLLLDDAAWDAIAGIIGPDDFYLGDHRSIFRCMQSLAEQDKPIDVITVSDALDKIRYQGLTDRSQLETEEDLRIHLILKFLQSLGKSFLIHLVFYLITDLLI